MTKSSSSQHYVVGVHVAANVHFAKLCLLLSVVKFNVFVNVNDSQFLGMSFTIIVCQENRDILCPYTESRDTGPNIGIIIA